MRSTMLWSALLGAEVLLLAVVFPYLVWWTVAAGVITSFGGR